MRDEAPGGGAAGAPLRIVECLTHSSEGGGQEAVHTLLTLLRRLVPDDALTVILPPGGLFVGRFRALGARTIEFPLDAITPGSVARFGAVLRSLRPSVVHSHGKGAGFYARFCGPAPIRRIHSYHGFHPPDGGAARRAYLAVERSLLRRTNVVLNVSASEGAEAAALFPRFADRFLILPNVVDARALRERAREPLPDRAAGFFAQLPADPFVVTMIARNDPLKNYPLACAAMARVMRIDDAAAFVVAGVRPVPPAVGRIAAEFPGRVLALPPFPGPAPLIAASHALLLTSSKEGGHPLVILEAQALGIPAVATDVPGCREAIADGKTGLLASESEEAVAAALLRLRREPGLRAAICAAAVPPAGAAGEWALAVRRIYTGAAG